jgi:tol-pal system protein YbgF
MNRFFFLLFLLPLILTGCIASQDEIQTLKIKVINLETTLNKQNQKSEELGKKLDEINKKLITLENKLSKEMMVEIKTQVLSELDEIKKEQAHLSSQVEELKFSQEESEKTLKTQLENLATQTQALELKIKELEKKLETAPKELPKESPPPPSNATLTSPDNATKIAAIKPEEKREEKSEEKPLSEAQFYERAYSYYQKGDLKNAKRLFEEYIEKFPKGNWMGQAYFWIGEIYFKEQKYEEAILNYQKLIELPGWHPLKPSAMLKQAQAFKALGDTEAYKILLKKLINQYPHSKEAEVAKKLLK